ncbi:MAG: TadE/TadG family type IV pilus assembly protein [Rhodospirillaceae bacterium]
MLNFKRYSNRRDGFAAVEFALIAPILVVALLGMFDFGQKAYFASELQQSVRSGGQYAIGTGHAADIDGITTIIQTSSKLTGIVVDALVSVCYCANGASIACTGTTCSDSSSVGNYVTITAHYTYTPLIQYFTVGNRTLTSSVTVRTS